ncbi:MAG: SufE family protein [Candidatus Carsonella ruddii]
MQKSLGVQVPCSVKKISIKNMINKIKKIKKKIFFFCFEFLIKIGFQKKKILISKYLLLNCIINTWIKIKKNKKKIFFYGYSNSLFLSGIIKIFFKILNNNKKNNIIIFFNFDVLLILKIKKKISNFKNESVNNIILYINNFIKYN